MNYKPPPAAPRYRKVQPQLWINPPVCSMSLTEKAVAFYMMTGPQTTTVGLTKFSIATAAEELEADAATAEKLIATVIKTMGWQHDLQRRVLYMPEWTTANLPANPNVCESWGKAVVEVPDSELKAKAIAHIAAVLLKEKGESFRNSFLEPFGKPLAEPFREPLEEPQPNRSGNRIGNQEQEQEQEQEQDQEQDTAAAAVTVKGFDEFWELYPRKEARKKAEKAFASLRPDPDLQARMIAAVDGQMRTPQWQRDAGYYIPHAATWISGRRWEDAAQPTSATVRAVAEDPLAALDEKVPVTYKERPFLKGAVSHRRDDGIIELQAPDEETQERIERMFLPIWNEFEELVVCVRSN